MWWLLGPVALFAYLLLEKKKNANNATGGTNQVVDNHGTGLLFSRPVTTDTVFKVGDLITVNALMAGFDGTDLVGNPIIPATFKMQVVQLLGTPSAPSIPILAKSVDSSVPNSPLGIGALPVPIPRAAILTIDS